MEYSYDANALVSIWIELKLIATYIFKKAWLKVTVKSLDSFYPYPRSFNYIGPWWEFSVTYRNTKEKGVSLNNSPAASAVTMPHAR